MSYVIVVRRTDKPKLRPWVERWDAETEEDISRDLGHGWPPQEERYPDRQAAKHARAKLREGMLPIYDFRIVPVTKGMRRERLVGVKF